MALVSNYTVSPTNLPRLIAWVCENLPMVAPSACKQILWLEYEAQVSIENRWVKVLDRFMPFFVNLSTQGFNWKEQSVSRSDWMYSASPMWAIELNHVCRGPIHLSSETSILASPSGSAALGVWGP
jgi:hypothetical protein